MNSKPLVSVVMITYGHKSYIHEAVESVLLQKCKFAFELIIADDNSPDNTEEVVREIQKNHPKGHLIKYTKHKENIGMMPNFIWALEQCKSKYVALCEGDDFWVDPLKLEKQVNFLDLNPNFSVCGHNVKSLRTNGELVSSGSHLDVSFSDRELIKYNLLTTLSVLFRGDLLKSLPSWFADFSIGDWPLFLHLTQYGKAYILKDAMGVHRVHDGGVWSKIPQDEIDQLNKNLINKLSEVFNEKYKKEAKEAISLIENNSELYYQPYKWLKVNYIKDSFFMRLSKKIFFLNS